MIAMMNTFVIAKLSPHYKSVMMVWITTHTYVRHQHKKELEYRPVLDLDGVLDFAHIVKAREEQFVIHWDHLNQQNLSVHWWHNTVEERDVKHCPSWNIMQDPSNARWAANESWQQGLNGVESQWKPNGQDGQAMHAPHSFTLSHQNPSRLEKRRGLVPNAC